MYNPRPWPFDVNFGPRQRFRGDDPPSQETHFEDMFDDDFDLDAEEPESPCGVTALNHHFPV